MKPKEIITNWNVITGGPCTGKTTVIDILSRRGYKTTIEHARHYVDTQRVSGKTVEEIRKNMTEFQFGVLSMQIQQEAELDINEQVFLEKIKDILDNYLEPKLTDEEYQQFISRYLHNALKESSKA